MNSLFYKVYHARTFRLISCPDAIIMIFELTNTYSVTLPMMTTCPMASLVQKSILSGSIHTLSLARKGVDIAAGHEMGILTSLKVKDVMEPAVARVAEGAP